MFTLGENIMKAWVIKHSEKHWNLFWDIVNWKFGALSEATLFPTRKMAREYNIDCIGVGKVVKVEIKEI